MEKHCYGCRYFKAYYTKGYADFTKTDLGFCRLHNKTLDKHECCDSHCIYHYGKLDGKTVIRCLNEALQSLTAIATIWSEQQNGK